MKLLNIYLQAGKNSLHVLIALVEAGADMDYVPAGFETPRQFMNRAHYLRGTLEALERRRNFHNVADLQNTAIANIEITNQPNSSSSISSSSYLPQTDEEIELFFSLTDPTLGK